MLAHVVIRVVAMLSHEADAVDRKFVPAQRQCFGDARAVPEAALRNHSAAHIIAFHLRGVHRDKAGFAAPSALRWEHNLPASVRRSRQDAHYECIGSRPGDGLLLIRGGDFCRSRQSHTLAAKKSRRFISTPPYPELTFWPFRRVKYIHPFASNRAPFSLRSVMGPETALSEVAKPVVTLRNRIFSGPLHIRGFGSDFFVGRRGLLYSCRERECLNPPHHRSEQPSSQMALRQEEPVVAGMFYPSLPPVSPAAACKLAGTSSDPLRQCQLRQRFPRCMQSRSAKAVLVGPEPMTTEPRHSLAAATRVPSGVFGPCPKTLLRNPP